MNAFEKVLSKNDTGESGSHQAGIAVPKSDEDILSFFPPLDKNLKNPDANIDCMDEDGCWWRFRYVYYNNKLHDPRGTRNEYRLTQTTGYLRRVSATAGQSLIFEKQDDGTYRIALGRQQFEPLQVTKLSGWRRVH